MGEIKGGIVFTVFICQMMFFRKVYAENACKLIPGLKI